VTIDVSVLTDWFARKARPLPWRDPDTSAWGVLVSEIMLQQTPVARVEPSWHEWMARWPTPSALANATPADVLRAWGKLGYPRRALRLRDAAAAIASEHNDVVPSDVDTLLALPGIGAYTARAVAAFAYRRRCPVVDTNVRRVIARAVHGAGDAGPASTARDLRDAEALLPADDETAARMSAALMELGATVCGTASPPTTGPPSRCRSSRAPTARCAGCCSTSCVTRPRPCPSPGSTSCGPTAVSGRGASTPCWWTGWSSRPTAGCSHFRVNSNQFYWQLGNSCPEVTALLPSSKPVNDLGREAPRRGRSRWPYPAVPFSGPVSP
jgi:endonuclease III